LIVVNHDQLTLTQADAFADKKPEKRADGHDANAAKLQNKHQNDNAESRIGLNYVNDRQSCYAHSTYRSKQTVNPRDGHPRFMDIGQP